MKIAIRGHESRGKEVIRILEQLGGKNTEKLEGTYKTFYYIDNKNEIGDDHKDNFPPTYKLYTLEEFEQEFPFKIGDEVIFPVINGWASGKITGIKDFEYEVNTIGGYRYVEPHKLSLYPMKEERNITLTLDKAQEWYKKGGELKEIALQAFSERELNPLPRSWEEFCKKHPVKEGESWLGEQNKIHTCTTSYDGMDRIYKNWMPSKKSAEAHLAMIQLEQLRNCWLNGWEPIWDCSEKWCIRLWGNELGVGVATHISRFLTFPTNEMAREFLECFRDLIEQAGDLI